MRTILLGVNIDHVATLRQTRLARYPDPVSAALVAERSGADSITLHLREDRRHIQERDVHLLKEVMQTPMNLEMAMTGEMLAFAGKVKPEYCCLVPERREELTTEGGLDVAGQLQRTRDFCKRLQSAGIRVSLFIDAEMEQINAAHEAGATVIELHTGHYANAVLEEERQGALQKIIDSVTQAHRLGMQVNAGHGLNYHNVQAIAAIQDITELNIGHGIIARAVFSGMSEAVSEMKRLMVEARI
jgi:pyridoxine 5''-phosphate synthase